MRNCFYSYNLANPVMLYRKQLDLLRRQSYMCLGTFRFLIGTYLADSVCEICAHTQCRPFPASRVQIEWVFLVQINRRFYISRQIWPIAPLLCFPSSYRLSSNFPFLKKILARVYLIQTGDIHQRERSQVLPSLQCFLLREKRVAVFIWIWRSETGNIWYALARQPEAGSESL